jgi:hypothetical protein
LALGRYKHGIGHVDFCGAHGVALARGRPIPSKQLLTGVSSWTKWINIDGNAKSFQMHLGVVVLQQRPVTWQQCQRPQIEVDAAMAFKRALFTDDSVLWTPHKHPDGSVTHTPSTLSVSLDRILACRRWAPGETDGMVHWCSWVLRTDAFGHAAGGWCCGTAQEARDKVLRSISEWLFARAWNVAADNRWTTQPAAQRRLLVAETIDQAITRTLDQVVLEFQLQKASVVAALTKILEDDRENWSARNKVRLQGIHQNLCVRNEFGLAPDTRLAIIVTAGRRLDDVLYSYLGRTKKGSRSERKWPACCTQTRRP